MKISNDNIVSVSIKDIIKAEQIYFDKHSTKTLNYFSCNWCCSLYLACDSSTRISYGFYLLLFLLSCL